MNLIVNIETIQTTTNKGNNTTAFHYFPLAKRVTKSFKQECSQSTKFHTSLIHMKKSEDSTPERVR